MKWVPIEELSQLRPLDRIRIRGFCHTKLDFRDRNDRQHHGGIADSRQMNSNAVVPWIRRARQYGNNIVVQQIAVDCGQLLDLRECIDQCRVVDSGNAVAQKCRVTVGEIAC